MCNSAPTAPKQGLQVYNDKLTLRTFVCRWHGDQTCATCLILADSSRACIGQSLTSIPRVLWIQDQIHAVHRWPACYQSVQGRVEHESERLVQNQLQVLHVKGVRYSMFEEAKG